MFFPKKTETIGDSIINILLKTDIKLSLHILEEALSRNIYVYVNIVGRAFIQ